MHNFIVGFGIGLLIVAWLVGGIALLACYGPRPSDIGGGILAAVFLCGAVAFAIIDMIAK